MDREEFRMAFSEVATHRRRWLGVVLAAGLIAGACSASATQAPAAAPSTGVAGASGQPAAATVGTATANGLGPFLTGAGGRTLYILTKDSPGTSTCTGGCAGAWPPFTVSGGTAPSASAGVTGKLATLTRSDGGIQVTYNGMPLYYFSGDSAAGQTNGQGVQGVWYVALAAGNGSTAAPSPSAVSGY
jgi:predicted lipoprotein with Yx(FWY)xxD motif